METKQRKKRAPNKFNYRDHYYKHFGRLLISTKALNYEDKPYILLKHNTEYLSAVPKLRRTEISEQFRNLLNNYLETGNISTDLQKELDNNEQSILKTAMYVAKIPNFEYQSKNISDYIKEFNMLKGSIISGNNSIENKQRIKEVIALLSNPIVNKIDIQYANEMIEVIDNM